MVSFQSLLGFRHPEVARGAYADVSSTAEFQQGLECASEGNWFALGYSKWLLKGSLGIFGTF